MKKVVIIHTSFISVDFLSSLFEELVPEAQLHHIVDDTLLAEIMASGGVTKNVARRYCAYAQQAQAAKADLIFSQCSSAGPAADIAGLLVDVPILKVDQAMAEEAVRLGRRIAVIATIGTTLEPSVKLIQAVAARSGKEVAIKPVLLPEAYEALFIQKNAKAHNQIIIDKINETQKDFDVIVLAQGSMVTLLSELKEVQVPLLTSPRLGVLSARQALGLV